MAASQRLKPQLHRSLCDYDVEVSLYILTFVCYPLKNHFLAFIEDSEQYARPLSRQVEIRAPGDMWGICRSINNLEDS